MVAQSLHQRLIPPAAYYATTGGELVAVFPNATAREAQQTLNEVRTSVRNQPSIPDVMATFSAGIVASDTASDRGRILDQARSLRLRAETEGGDRVQVQSEPINERPRILLAEDDTLTARLIVHRLEREGYEVSHHADGESALTEARAGRHDLAILDVKMPRMDGFEVLGRMKEDPGLAGKPVVMLTGMGAEQDVVRALSGGADDYILKPFSPAELALRVQRLLAKP
jgi:CheY-like chemotaxis protein